MTFTPIAFVTVNGTVGVNLSRQVGSVLKDDQKKMQIFIKLMNYLLQCWKTSPHWATVVVLIKIYNTLNFYEF